MLKEVDFVNLLSELLFCYRQVLLSGILHERVNSNQYQIGKSTWDTILNSLEKDAALGLAKLLENKFFGRPFQYQPLEDTRRKLNNLRNGLIAHNDLSKMRQRASFLEDNQLNGGELIIMVDALKRRAREFQDTYKSAIDVESAFRQTTQDAASDANIWLASFAKPM